MTWHQGSIFIKYIKFFIFKIIYFLKIFHSISGVYRFFIKIDINNNLVKIKNEI